MSKSTKKPALLITGATGKQGGAVIRALLSANTVQSYNIIALTRSTSSKSAQALASKGITIVEGDLDAPSDLFTRIAPIWGVFSVQLAVPGSDSEERQGKALVDTAVKNGVQHFVYSSGDRGGPERSDIDETPVANLAAKFRIEKYLEEMCGDGTGKDGRMTYAVLRPVTFFENLTTDRHGMGFARMWEQIGKPLQFVSTKDVGYFGAQALLHPEAWKGRKLSLAGDELSQPEADVVFKEVVGKEMPIAPCVVGKLVKFLVKELGPLFKWLEEEGWGADVKECRRENSGMQDFRAWLVQESGFVERS